MAKLRTRRILALSMNIESGVRSARDPTEPAEAFVEMILPQLLNTTGHQGSHDALPKQIQDFAISTRVDGPFCCSRLERVPIRVGDVEELDIPA